MRLIPLLLAVAVLSLPLPPAAAQTLRVMSFNVRLPSPDDGANRWELRRDLMVRTIREQAPDLVGTQELYKLQGDYLVGKLAHYAWFGRGRRGDRGDERPPARGARALRPRARRSPGTAAPAGTRGARGPAPRCRGGVRGLRSDVA